MTCNIYFVSNSSDTFRLFPVSSSPETPGFFVVSPCKGPKRKVKCIDVEAWLLRPLGFYGCPVSVFSVEGGFQSKEIGFLVLSSSYRSVFWKSVIDEICSVSSVFFLTPGSGWLRPIPTPDLDLKMGPVQYFYSVLGLWLPHHLFVFITGG